MELPTLTIQQMDWLNESIICGLEDPECNLEWVLDSLFTLMEYMINTYTNEGETVLDFTMGSGATIRAANNLNRNSIGIEMGYCEKKGHKYEGWEWTDVIADQLNIK